MAGWAYMHGTKPAIEQNMRALAVPEILERALGGIAAEIHSEHERSPLFVCSELDGELGNAHRLFRAL